MNKVFLLLLLLLPWGLAAQTTIDAPSLKALLNKDKSVVVMDVRTLDEYQAGHLPGAKLLPFDAIDASSAAKLLAKKTTPVVVYCHSGRRAAIAAQSLAQLGYKTIYDLGAIARWDGPLVR